MRILIIGSEGFVGQNLVNYLSTNHQIFCADLYPSSNQKNYHQIDITDLSSVLEIVRDFDVVINLAAHSLVSSLDGTIENAKVNIIGLLNILESCKKNKIKKIIFTSASSLIGIPNNERVSEHHFPLPKTAYGISKLASEHYIRLYHELYGLNYVIFRFFNIYGPYQKNGLIPSLYNRIINHQPVTIFGKGDQIRDYVFIEDVVSFFEDAINSSKTDNQIFNMGTGNGYTIKEVVNFLAKSVNIEAKIDFQAERPGEIGNFVSDTSTLYSVFKKIPNTSLDDGIKKTVDWLKQH